MVLHPFCELPSNGECLSSWKKMAASQHNHRATGSSCRSTVMFPNPGAMLPCLLIGRSLLINSGINHGQLNRPNCGTLFKTHSGGYCISLRKAMKSTGRKYSKHYEQRQASFLLSLTLAKGIGFCTLAYVAGSFSAGRSRRRCPRDADQGLRC